MSQNKDDSGIESNIIFEGITPKLFQSFANPKNAIGKKEGAVIYQKGDLTEYLYLLIEGTVKLKYTEPDGTNIYINKTADSFFGETELIGKTQRKSSAVADTDCRMYTFNLSELKILVKKDEQILKNLYKNKTFDFLDKEFIESSKDFLDPETDFAELIRTTTETPAKKRTNSEVITSVAEEKETPKEEHGAFDNIITKEEEIEEENEQSENIPEESTIKEDGSIVIKDSEEEKISQSGHDAFDNIIPEEEIEDENEQPEYNPEEDIIKEDDSIVIDKIEDIEKEKNPSEYNSFQDIVGGDNSIEFDKVEEEQENDDLIESKGFIIKEPPEPESIKTFETQDTPVQEESEPEPAIEKDEDEEITDFVEQEKGDDDFSDYYETLLNATQNIFSKITIDETAQVIAESATKLINATGGILYLVDKENEELKAKVLSDNSIKDIRIKFSDGLQGTAIIEKRSIIVENPRDDKNFNPAIEDLTGIKIKNVIYYPVLTKSDEPIAVLELYNSERGKFDSREIELLNAISSSILRALNNTRYVDILVQQRKILALGEITGLIKDDIKNSLLKVKHYSSLLKKKNLSPEVNKLIDLQIGQINSVEDFLKFTDAYANGKNITEKSTIKVSEAVTQILNFLAEYVDSRNTVIYKKVEDNAVINVDLPSMYLVCYQIAKNACDAMNNDGKIFVTSERDGNYIKVNFRDTGVGISETIKGKLFKPFVTYGKKQRPGLGLAIAEKLVSDQGGYMLAESTLGEGATFTIALPIVF
jgi:signal transduction histidine kinase